MLYLCRVKIMRVPILIALLCVLFSACSEYNKILKSSDLELKYEKAIEFYEEGEYYKAYPLLEELIGIYRGTERAEKLYYLFAYCDYGLGDYLLAAHRFQYFTKTYPTSKFTEECSFMSAYCHYINAPGASLDQTNTRRAMNELQLFLGRYPESTRRDSCNTLVQELHVKLEDKTFAIAKQYLHTRYYKSAIVAFDNFLKDFPDTHYREESTFLKLRAQYLLATRSIISKQEERYAAIEKQYQVFVDSYSKSSFLREAETIYKDGQMALARLQTELPEVYIERGQYTSAVKFLDEKLKVPTNSNAEYQTFLLHKALYLKALQVKKDGRTSAANNTLARYDALTGKVQNPKWARKVEKFRQNLTARGGATAEATPTESSSTN